MYSEVCAELSLRCTCAAYYCTTPGQGIVSTFGKLVRSQVASSVYFAARSVVFLSLSAALLPQANAVSDKVLDLRRCDYSGKDLSGKTLAGALLSDTDMSNTNLREAVLTKSYGVGAILSGADLTNAVVDRVDFSRAKLNGAKFVNAVVTGTTFEGADLSESVWEDALIGNEDVKRLCSNPTLTGESRFQVGCRGK
eukprot:GHRQ01016335.1.p1 GENE.GHRQ01016335.1~~GHRQ01016335.1.p1  ORF type:complete len:196 (+),score=65.67 GHRQ01016335.1:434-1021(+)